MGSANGIINRVVNTGALGVVGTVLRQRKLSAEKKGRQDAAAGAAAADAAAKEEIARRKAITDASVKAQKDKARKRTIFAGSGTSNIFSNSLGGSTGKETLG